MDLNRFNRVYAVGRDSYIRFYPNPGVGLCLGTYRVAASLYGGFEVFKKHPVLVWRRTHAYLSRVKRPGSRV